MGRKKNEQKIYSPYFSRRKKKKEKNKGRGFLFFTSRPLGREARRSFFVP